VAKGSEWQRQCITFAGVTFWFLGDFATIWVSDGATVTMVECFVRLSMTFEIYYSTDEDEPYHSSAIVSVNAVNPTQWYAQQQDTIVYLERCTFHEDNDVKNYFVTNKDDGLYPAHSALIYSDVAIKVLHISNRNTTRILGAAEPLSKAPAARQGITGSSQWLLRVQVSSSRFLCSANTTSG
jgi:hypothetical protein